MTDSIERSVIVAAPPERVWLALSDAAAFGAWFGVDLAGQRFAPGERARGRFTLPGAEHAWFDVVVERVDAPRCLAFRWHPYPLDPAIDYGAEEPTLVTFSLEAVPGGTRVTVVESGFDRVAPLRRLEAFRMNERGWDHQLERLTRHVEP